MITDFFFFFFASAMPHPKSRTKQLETHVFCQLKKPSTTEWMCLETQAFADSRLRREISDTFHLQCQGQTGGDSTCDQMPSFLRAVEISASQWSVLLWLFFYFFLFPLDVPMLLIVKERIYMKSLFTELMKRNCSYICFCGSWHGPGLVCHLQIPFLHETLNSCCASQRNNFLPFSQEQIVEKFHYQFNSSASVAVFQI